MRTTLTVNLAALKHNYSTLAKCSNKLFAVVKTNAYGLGLKEVVLSLANKNLNQVQIDNKKHTSIDNNKHIPVDNAQLVSSHPELVSGSLPNKVYGFAVSRINEALTIRALGIDNLVLLLTGFFDEKAFKQALKHHIILAITTPEQAEFVLKSQDVPSQIFLKLDSGMSRLGLTMQEFREFYPKLTQKLGKNNIVLMSHFACSDDKNHPHNNLQIENFNAIKNEFNIDLTSFNNSNAILNNLYFDDYSRTGIAMYGGLEHPSLQTVAILSAPIIAIKTLDAGDKIGYSVTWTCKRKTKIAIVSIGYGDGILRALTGGEVFVAQQKAKILGVISMDMLAIDITHISTKIGDSVEIFGENIKIYDVAKQAETISYELFTHLGNNIKNVYNH
jgi:alanine racemase